MTPAEGAMARPGSGTDRRSGSGALPAGAGGGPLGCGRFISGLIIVSYPFAKFAEDPADRAFCKSEAF